MCVSACVRGNTAMFKTEAHREWEVKWLPNVEQLLNGALQYKGLNWAGDTFSGFLWDPTYRTGAIFYIGNISQDRSASVESTASSGSEIILQDFSEQDENVF